MLTIETLVHSVSQIIKNEKKVLLILLYYSVLEAVLVLSIPLSSSFIINSVIAHAEISVLALGFIVFMLFILITLLKVTREYIIEKFQQKVFVSHAIEIAQSVFQTKKSSDPTHKEEHKKHMNYFFDIVAIQKFFPILLLDGMGLLIKISVSLLLLFIFDDILFKAAMLFFILYLLLLLLLGRKGLSRAIKRSDTKHEAIYFLQNLDHNTLDQDKEFQKLDHYLLEHTKARRSMFKTIISQQGLTFFTEGLIMSGFLVLGSYLVIKGTIPLGEFIASEIIILTIVYALKSFVKKLDFFYEAVEGFYKVSKLKYKLEQEGKE